MKHQKNPRIHQVFLSAAIAVVLIGSQSRLDAASVVFDKPAGNWSGASNWASESVPTSADSAFIRMNREVTVDTDIGTVINVYLGQTGSGGTVFFNAGAILNVTTDFEVMREGAFESIGGTLNMSGGTLNVAQKLIVGAGGSSTSGTSSGAATVSGGTLNASITLGSAQGTATGYFNVMGAAANISGANLLVNASGNLSFTFGATGVSLLNYGAGTATFASGSTFAVNGADYLGADGDIKLVDGATLSWNVQPDDISITGFNGFTTELLTAGDDVILRLTAVPEPSAVLLLCAAAPLLAWRGRRVARA